MDRHHFTYIVNHQLGIGSVLPVPYDTAWLARIPDFPATNKPAFPQALAWLRQQQFSDGSWGSLQPLNAHSNTLSTLAAILALKQWENAEDTARIEKGLKALIPLA